MQQIINFFLRNKNFLLFLFLMVVSLSLTVGSHSYHQSKVVSSANYVTGSLFSVKNEITGYFGLRTENERLLDENSRLRNQLQALEQRAQPAVSDSVLFDLDFKFRTAEVIHNSYSRVNNYLTLKKGSKDGIEPLMGVVSSKGIVGIVDEVSPNFATVLSVLNNKSSFSVKLKDSGHFGSLVWNGKDPGTVQLIDIPRLASLAVGDTITTDGRSTIFPKGIPVGTISEYTLDPAGNFYIIDVSLFNDMTSIENVYIIENTQAEEILELEATTTDGN